MAVTIVGSIEGLKFWFYEVKHLHDVLRVRVSDGFSLYRLLITPGSAVKAKAATVSLTSDEWFAQVCKTFMRQEGASFVLMIKKIPFDHRLVLLDCADQSSAGEFDLTGRVSVEEEKFTLNDWLLDAVKRQDALLAESASQAKRIEELERVLEQTRKELAIHTAIAAQQKHISNAEETDSLPPPATMASATTDTSATDWDVVKGKSSS